MAATLAQLKTRVRQRSDQENSTFISDSELLSYINGSYSELYDLLVSKFEDYFTIPYAVTVASGASTISLPADFYKLRGLDWQNSPSTTWLSVPRFNFSERNAQGRAVFGGISAGRRVSYSVLGASIKILPESDAPGTYQLWYVPRFTPLAADTDSVSNVLDFEEYIVVDSAIKCLVKEESDPMALMKAKEDLKLRINTMAAQRDASGSGRVGDVQSQGSLIEDYFPF